jgi:imidazolonepropionase-like amidohydrolase
MKAKLVLSTVLMVGLCFSLLGQSGILIKDVHIFNGKDEKLVRGHVLVQKDTIAGIFTTAPQIDANVQMVDGMGQYLIPGLIDAHWHASLAAVPQATLLTADFGYVYIIAADQAEKTLMRGFTSVRDLSGPSFGLKRAIDEGWVGGPRIYPSGAMISQTSGHGDFRLPYEIPSDGNTLSYPERVGAGAIADGADAVLKRSREQLMMGATQLKLAAGGGISSSYDPIDVSQYTEDEIRAAVEAAENWGTYVTVHAYTPRALQTAIRAGVKCVDHGHLMDEETAKMMAQKGVWLSMQPFLDEFSKPYPIPALRAKQLEVYRGTDRAYELAKKYKLKLAWGTDILFDAQRTLIQGTLLAAMKRWFSPYEILKMATSTNAELLALSGPRNPYPRKLGVVETGAYADLILVKGNPLENIDLVSDPDQNFLMIMKDGKIYKGGH